MHHCEQYIDAASWLSVLAKQVEAIVAFLFSEVEIVEFKGVLVSLYVKSLCYAELVGALLGDVKGLGVYLDCDGAEVRRHLEVKKVLLVVFELDVFEVFGDWDRIYVVHSRKHYLRILQYF